MTRFCLAALGAVISLGACTPPEIASRLDSTDTLYSSFEAPGDYTPEPIGSRADNGLMRFSTMSLAR